MHCKTLFVGTTFFHDTFFVWFDIGKGWASENQMYHMYQVIFWVEMHFIECKLGTLRVYSPAQYILARIVTILFKYSDNTYKYFIYSVLALT